MPCQVFPRLAPSPFLFLYSQLLLLYIIAAKKNGDAFWLSSLHEKSIRHASPWPVYSVCSENNSPGPEPSRSMKPGRLSTPTGAMLLSKLLYKRSQRFLGGNACAGDVRLERWLSSHHFPVRLGPPAGTRKEEYYASWPMDRQGWRSASSELKSLASRASALKDLSAYEIMKRQSLLHTQSFLCRTSTASVPEPPQ